jgi:hypothetical protein
MGRTAPKRSGSRRPLGTKVAIPKLAVRLELARRFIRAAANELHQTITRKGKPGRSRRSGVTKGNQRFRPNPWKKCPTCYHRAPKMCRECGKGRAGVVPTHMLPCCPGACLKCKRCKDPSFGCPGRCPDGCGKCADRCECDKEKIQ